MEKRTTNLRWRLLVLLWVWAICVFAVVDLFLNVEEFDGIRPRARLYRGMRVAAHEMVGEPIAGDESNVRQAAVTRSAAEALTSQLARVRDNPGRDELRWQAAHAEDPRVRIAALDELARRFQSRDVLLGVTRCRDEIIKVRRQAARMLAWTGANAETDLDAVLDSTLPQAVRAGAVLGLGELGNVSATEKLLALAGDKTFRAEALAAIARIAKAEAAPVLREAALASDIPAETRRAACRALYRIKEPATVRTLMTVLADTRIEADVRAMAADSLGRMGDRNALAVVATATGDGNPAVARKARLAQTRLQ